MSKNKKIIFSGVGTALVTPFKNGEIDYAKLDSLIDMQLDAGVDALVIGGTTGEAATLTEKERYTLYSYATERIGGRAKVVLGTGTNDTSAAIRHTRFAAECGADGALAVTPYYNKGTEEGVYRHYMSIADCSEIPIILYNVPSRTGVNLGINLLRRLGEHEQIVGIKEASDSTDRLVELSVLADKLPLYAGNDSQIYVTMALGGLGVISVVSNILPGEVKRIATPSLPDPLTALRTQHKLLPLIKVLFAETNPSPVKYAMSLMGLCLSDVRLPLSEPRESTKIEIAKAISDYV